MNGSNSKPELWLGVCCLKPCWWLCGWMDEFRKKHVFRSFSWDLQSCSQTSMCRGRGVPAFVLSQEYLSQEVLNQEVLSQEVILAAWHPPIPLVIRFLLPDFFGSIDLSSYFCTCNRKLSLISYSFCALEFYNSLETDRKYLESTWAVAANHPLLIDDNDVGG